jgi:SAM-dependent methyltransferase
MPAARTRPRGLGASIKDAFAHCQESGFDIVAILHADGKYAPETIDSLIAPLLREEVDAVFGSRFLAGRPPRRDMPLHKYLAIRLLRAVHNRVIDLELSEHHCGYRAYSVEALAGLPYALNSDDIHFDTEIIVQLRQKGLKIAEVPVPVYSGSETDSFRGVAYTFNVMRVLVQYWLHERGLREYPKFAITEKYVYKTAPEASHQKILSLVDKDRQRVLDVGCGAGYLADALRQRGNQVVGVDVRRTEGIEERVDEFHQVDLDREEIPRPDSRFSFIILADVLEHLREPERLVARCRDLLADDGALIVSVPNVAHWSVRLSLLVGRFAYTARGILDKGHLRFFTLASILRELGAAGFSVERIETTPVPLEELLGRSSLGPFGRLLRSFQRLATRVWKEFFGYQFILRARKKDG